MCTASWLTAGDRFHLLFNRDERRTRAVGLPPRLLSAEGVAYLAPLDPDSGGTWFAATERGLLLALLNRSVDGQPAAAGRRSRGSLIPELVTAGDVAEVAALLAAQALADCAPFRLFADLPGAPALGAVWDGQRLATQPITTSSGLLCSSSRGDHEVTRVRSELWSARSRERETAGLEELRRFHRSHLPTRSAASVCMHRDDAATVSHLEVLRTPGAIEVAYFAGSPCSAGEPERSTLPLTATPARGSAVPDPMPVFARPRSASRLRGRAAGALARALLLALALSGLLAGPQVPAALALTPDPPPAAERPATDWEGRFLGTLDRLDPGAAADGSGPLAPAQQWLLYLLLAAATLVSEDLTCVAAGLLASHGKIPLAAAMLACLVGIFVGDLLLVLAGRLLGRRVLERAPLRWLLTPRAVERSERWFTAQGTKVVLASRFVPGSRLPLFLAAGILRAPFARVAVALLLAGVVWTPLLVGLSAWTGGAVLAHLRSYERVALPALVATLAVTFVFARIVVPLFSWRGRRLLLSRWRRLTRWEFWPTWIFQLPVVLHGLWQGLRHRHPTVFTAVNPGIPSGGFVEESKSGILERLAGPAVARFATVDLPAERGQRLAALRKALARSGLGYPVVLKPDIGERGRGVAVVRSEDELAAYLDTADGRLIAQEYVAGEEFGVFYIRHPAAERGRIFSITGKRFPVVVGDGRRTLEELILADDRAVCMAAYYMEANFERLDDIPAIAERVQLVEIGNHCRGTVFLDGREHRTPELEAAIEALARRFDGFYFGRFDLRVPTVEQFRAGVGLRILELNGVTSEATHIYAPGASLFAAYRTLFEQWRLAFEIGAANAARGSAPTGLRDLLRLLRNRRSRFGTIPTPVAPAPPPSDPPQPAADEE